VTKRQFIQHTAPLMLLAQLMREEKADPARAIAWAESLWERLSAVGYGPETGTGPRDIKDHVAALSPELADSFARLWRAYHLPKGKQDAAQRWAQIAPDAALAEVIIAAADADSREPRPDGAVRKWLQGWLSERRWEDRGSAGVAPASPGRDAQAPIDARRSEVADLLGERARLLRLAKLDIAAADHAALEAIDTRLRALGIDSGAAAPKKPSGPSPVAHLLRPPVRPIPEDSV
jgi:hypothetical protein